MSDCLFCRIAQGEIPCYKIYEDADHLAFLDKYPLAYGQVLVIPKQHFSSYLFNMPTPNYNALMHITQQIAKQMDHVLQTKRTHMVVEGLEIDHVHIKLYPFYDKPPVPEFPHYSLTPPSPEAHPDILANIAKRFVSHNS